MRFIRGIRRYLASRLRWLEIPLDLKSNACVYACVGVFVFMLFGNFLARPARLPRRRRHRRLHPPPQQLLLFSPLLPLFPPLQQLLLFPLLLLLLLLLLPPLFSPLPPPPNGPRRGPRRGSGPRTDTGSGDSRRVRAASSWRAKPPEKRNQAEAVEHRNRPWRCQLQNNGYFALWLSCVNCLERVPLTKIFQHLKA